MNLALKSSLKCSKPGPSGRLGLSHALNTLLNQLHADLSEGQVTEVAMRAGSDGWLVGKSSGARAFFLLFDSRYSNLSEVHQEVIAFSNMHFSNIFLER